MDNKTIKDNLEHDKGNNSENMPNLLTSLKSTAVKKSEKICSAILLVTGFLNEKEPMKWGIREKSTELLSLISDISFLGLSGHSDVVLQAKKLISEISSYLDVMSASGLISGMNAAVLSSELSSLSVVIDSESGIAGKLIGVKIPNSYFDGIYNKPLLNNGVDNLDKYEGKTNSEPYNIKDKITNHSENARKITHTEAYPRQEKVKEFGSVAMKRNKRQSFIIQALKRKKELTIKDISTIFHDCSEKTIQRELAVLVDDGVVVKDGERRWTKYSLALTA